MVNLELPWNPAVLEQRIARVHRMGQNRPVRVVNFVTRGTIEERVLRTLEAKQGLFAGLFEGDEDEIPFEAVGRTGFLDSLRDMLAERAEGRAEAPTPAAHPKDAFLAAAVQLLEALAPIMATEESAGGLSADLRRRIAAVAELVGRAAAPPPDEPGRPT